MVLLFLHDGSKVEIPRCADVVHKSGSVICLDDLDAPIASFVASDVLGYSLNPAVARAINTGRMEKGHPRRSSTKTKPG